MIQSLLERYEIQTPQDAYQAMREIVQEIALAGLYKGGFFSHAAFYGGTALRIFHKLPRFSEDLDFTLLQKNTAFSIEAFFPFIIEECAALGLSIDIQKKIKTNRSPIESAFLKTDTNLYNLYFNSKEIQKTIKIKIELDTSPPFGFQTEEKLSLVPYSFYVKCIKLHDLFADKISAVLFRTWKHRVKGRDWFDFEWYVRKNQSLRLDHLVQRLLDGGHLSKAESFSKDKLAQMLYEKIDSVNFDLIKADVIPFIKDSSILDIWDKAYFKDLTNQIRII